jgi:xanthine/uracil permease
MAGAERPAAGLGWAAFVPAVLQHFGLGVATLVIPRLLAQAAGLPPLEVESYCQIAMIAVGIATLLQAWGWRGIGSGYLLPACFTGIYAGPLLVIARSEGLGAVAGLTIIAGLTQVVLSRVLRHVRGFIPTDVIGVCVVMIGLAWGGLGLKLMGGLGPGQIAARLEWIAGAVALAAMIAFSIWGGRRTRPLAVLIGLAAGCLCAVALYAAFGGQALAMPRFVLAIPHWPLVSVSFTGAYLPGVMIGAVVSFLRMAGDVVASHQVSDRNWKRPNTRAVAAGGLAEGLANIMAGFLGSMPINTNSGSVGLVAASGISAPRVAMGVGVMWIVFGLLPFGPPLLLLIPGAVQGAAVFFTAGFLIRAGITMLTQRVFDNRRAITLGSALVVGLSFEDILHAVAMPEDVRMVFSSALLLSVTVAIVLNAVFRIGVKRKVAFSWNPAEGDAVLRSWIETEGRLWGARTGLVARAEAVVEEFAQAMGVLARGPVAAVAQYDEVTLKLDFTWEGDPLPGPAGTRIDPAAADAARLPLAVAMLRHQVDHLAEQALGAGRQRLTLTLDDL